MKSSRWQRMVWTALFIACIGSGESGSQALAMENAGLATALSVSAAAPDIGKNYNIGGMMSMTGNVTAGATNPNGPINMQVGTIRNDSSTTTSGMLRLRMFIAPVPFDGTRAYYTIAEATLNPLAPLASYTNLNLTVPFIVPPDGVYYAHIGIFEREEGCASADGFCVDTYGTFPTQVQVFGGGLYAYAAGATTTTAVEYYHAEFDHYFFTAIPDEISKLDSGLFGGWARTGRTFGIWNSDTGGLAAVCRFFSTAFGSKSSHFYTPLSNECAIVRNNPDWQYEGIVAYLILPSANGTCAMGLPLYRLYNDGMGGAPNHRYTTSLTVRAAMIAAGWIPEGSGIGVIGCVAY